MTARLTAGAAHPGCEDAGYAPATTPPCTRACSGSEGAPGGSASSSRTGASSAGAGRPSEAARALMSGIDAGPAALDDLIEGTNLEASRALAAAELELAGLAHRTGADLCLGAAGGERSGAAPSIMLIQEASCS